MEDFTCTCGGTIAIPPQPAERQLAMYALCSNEGCNKLWEFLYDADGRFLGQPPKPVDRPPGS